MADGFGVVSRKQPSQVVHLINRASVDEEHILVVLASAYKHAGKPFRAGGNAGLQLECLDDICFAEQGRHAFDGVLAHDGHAHLCASQLVFFVMAYFNDFL